MQLARIRRYPMKGLRGTDLDRTTLEAGRGIPFDRHLAPLLPPLPDVATTAMLQRPRIARFPMRQLA
jgi:uncharacterized protein YcbX